MGEKKTILIADDSITGRKLLCDMLNGEYNILQAADGAEALNILKCCKNTVSLVILDLYMPRMDGYEALAKIRSDPEIGSIPVIVATSNDQINGEIRALELGADDFVVKPYDRRVLNLRINGILRRFSGFSAPVSEVVRDQVHSMVDGLIGGTGIFELSLGHLVPVFLSELYYSIFGKSANSAADTGADFFERVHPDDVGTLREKMETAVTADVNVFGEYRVKRCDGREIWVRMQAARIPYAEKKNSIFQCYFLDITDIKNERSSLRSYSVFDSLTEIYTRFSFIEAVRARIKNSACGDNVLIRINIERFKVINEIFGAETGDAVLRGVAEILRGTLYSIGDFGRLEGDNFVVCFSIKKFEPMHFIDMINKRVKARFPEYNIVLSYGIYVIDDTDTPVEVMFDRAQMALRSIKTGYVTRFAFYNERMLRAVVEEQEIVGEMESALESGQFVFILQPIFDSQTRAVVGAEALARWQHPKKGVIMPSRFVPIFESNGFITKLDHYIWESVCKLLAKWKQNGEKIIPISVNVSRTNMFNPMLCEQLLTLVEKYGLDPSCLKLEITESAYTDSPEQLREAIATLRENGFKILMDDFGSGYSSLNMLKDISVDILKIDSQFLVDFESSGRSARVLTSVVRMAGWLDMSVIAEGIETQAQAEFVRSIGCECMQGYLFSPPVSVEEFEKLKSSSVSFSYENEIAKYSDAEYEMLFDPSLHSIRFFDSVMGGMGIYELYGDRLELVRVNSGYYELFGYNPNDMSGQLRRDFANVSPEDRTPIINACRRAVDKNSVEKIVLRRSRKDGSVIWVALSIRCLGLHNGTPILSFSLNDITSQKKAEHELLLQRYAKGRGCEYNELFTLDAVNNTYERIETGCEIFSLPEHTYYCADIFSLIINSYIHKQDRELLSDMVSAESLKEQLAGSHEERSVGLRLTLPNESVQWCRADMFFDEELSVFVLGLMIQTDEQKAQEILENGSLTLSQTAESFSLLNQIPIGIAIYELDEKLKTVYVNDTLLNIYGYTKEQYENELGDNALVAIDESWREAFVPELKRAIITTKTIEAVIKTRKRDGSVIWVQIIGRAQINENNKVIGYSIQRDFTADMRARLRNRSRSEHMRALLEESDAILFEYDIENDTMMYSIPQKGRERRYITVAEYLSGISHNKLLHPDHREMVKNKIMSANIAVPSGKMEFMAALTDDKYVWYRAHYVCVKDDENKLYRIVGRLTNIDEQKHAESRLRDEQEYRNAMAAKALLVYEASLTNGEAKLLHSDKTFLENFLTCENYIRIESHPEMIHPEDAAVVAYHFSYEHFYSQFSSGKTEVNCRYRVKNRSGKWVWVDTASHIFRAATGELKRLSYMTLIDEQMRRSSELLQKAERDGLSGLFNRSTVEEQMRNVLSLGNSHAFILIDIDDFKSFNDNFGHMTGDSVISDIGTALKNSFRDSDIVGRLGGDEFVVLVGGSMNENTIREKLDRLAIRISILNSDSPQRPPITISVGVAFAPQDGASFETLYSRADRALYYAKNNGRSRIAFYSEIIEEEDG